MEPFSITCTTCQARLRVRDASAIGQILACPKCGSMVLVTHPTGAPAPPAAGPVQPESAVSPSQDITRDTPREETPEGEKRPRTFKFREDFELTEEGTTAKTPHKLVTPAPPKSSTPAVASAEQNAQDGTLESAHYADPTERTVPTTGNRYRQWMLIGGAAAVGVALAVLVVGILAARRSKESDTSQPVSQSPSQEDKAPAETAEQAIVTPDATDAVEVARDESSGDSKEVPRSNDAQQSAEPPKKADSDAAADGNSGEKTEKVASPETLPAAEELSPPGFVPRDASDRPDGNSLPPLTKTRDVRENDSAASHPADDSSPDVSAELATTIVAVEFDQIALADFAQFVSSFTTIPVTLDIDTLLAAGITAETKLEFQLRGVTIEQMLRAALEPQGLAFSNHAGQLVISLQDGGSSEPLTTTYDVSDLAAEEDERKVLARYLTSLIAPSSWSETGGEGTLVVTDTSLEIQQTATVHSAIALFLDRLRTARALLPRSDQPPELLDVTPTFVQAVSELSVPVAANFSDPTTLQSILDFLQTQTDLRLLTDWQSMAELGLRPSTVTTLTLAEQPWHELLDAWLHPLQLDYRVVDAGTIQISSQLALLKRPELQLYQVGTLSEADAGRLVAELKAHIGKPFFSAEGGIAAIVYDAPSRCLLVSLPQPQQRAIADWLRLNRKTKLNSDGHVIRSETTR